MNEIELIVSLKIPDAIAITAFHTLEKLGYNRLQKLKREDYYRFSTSEPISKFSKKIGKVDILVNANKHKFVVKSAKEPFEEEKGNLFVIKIIVKDREDRAKALLKTLQERLGLKQIKKLEKAALWTLYIAAPNEDAAKLMAKDITWKLLFNENYQEYKIIQVI